MTDTFSLITKSTVYQWWISSGHEPQNPSRCQVKWHWQQSSLHRLMRRLFPLESNKDWIQQETGREYYWATLVKERNQLQILLTFLLLLNWNKQINLLSNSLWWPACHRMESKYSCKQPIWGKKRGLYHWRNQFYIFFSNIDCNLLTRFTVNLVKKKLIFVK